MDKENQISDFLSQLFARLNREGITYCVLRNYESLPEKVGNDIDIWVKDGEQKNFQEILFESAKKLRWTIVEYSPRLSYQGEGDYFLVKDSQGLNVIHIDCWTFLHWRGITFVDENVLSAHTNPHKNGFFVPSSGIEASILLLKDLLYHGRVAEKYKDRILDCSNEDSESFLEAIRKPFSKKDADFILNMAKSGKWEELENNHRSLRRTLFKNALLKKPLLQLKHWAIYFYGRLDKFLLSKGGMFLVLIGPDGSGKSTTAELLLESKIEKLFQKKNYFHGHFHFLPELKKIASFFQIGGKKSPSNYKEHHGKFPEPFGFLRCIVYPLYYGLNYFIGHILIKKIRARDGLVIFDRYFYDYLIQRQFSRCPRLLLYTIAKIIPKPDMIIYLKNNPEEIYKRKPELPIEEIERQSKTCEDIASRFKNTVVIETSCNPEKVAEKIQRIIINRVKEKQRAKA
jgi:thymidylate kinase